MIDVSQTRLSFKRSLSSYSKIQWLVGELIRNRPMFYKPWPSAPFYLDIGPGPNSTPGFYNVDYMWSPGLDRCLDITKGVGLPEGRVLGAFTEHCLEHIEIEQCATLLGEIHRSLVPGGTLRVIVPDLEIYAREYVRSLETGRNSVPYGSAGRAGFVAPSIPFNHVMRGHGHRYIYDFMTLKAMLERAGYTNIRKCGFRDGNDARLLKDIEYRQHESLYVEAQKAA